MKKNRSFRRGMAVVLCFAMVLSCLPLGVFAAKLDNFDTNGGFKGKKLSVIGDSISTYYGVSNSSTYNPLYLVTSEATFGTYYGNTSHGDYAEFSDVKRADTWWQQVVDTLGMDLLVNNAWSGSYVLKDAAQSNTTEYGAAAYKDRSVNLHKGSTAPDVIAVYLGTNDVANYSSTSVGSKSDVDSAGERGALFTSVDKYAMPTTSVQAYYIMISRMLAKYPNAEIYCMIPTICLAAMPSGRQNALDNFNAGVKYIVDHYAGQGRKIYLVDLDNDCGLNTNDTVKDFYYCNNVHPSVEGMDWITSCLISEMLEHSQKRTDGLDNYAVTYDLDGAFVKTGRVGRAVEGKPLKLDFLPYESYQDIRLEVTMTDAVTGQAMQIPGLGSSGESVYIPEVKGPIHIRAVADKNDNYYWKAGSKGLVSQVDREFSFMDQTMGSGSCTSAGVMTDVKYSMAESVVLQADKPWELEFKGGGDTFAGGIMLFSATDDPTTVGNLYVHINQSNVLFGYRTDEGYNNSGIAWTTIADKLGSGAGAGIRQEIHTYRFVNEPSASGNQLRLYCDGVDCGTMDQVKLIGSSATHASASSVDISKKDFVFGHIGATGFPLRYCTIEYIKVWENGSKAPQSEMGDMRWEMDAAGNSFASVDDGDGYRENALTLLSGSVSGGTVNSAHWKLYEPVVLMHDKAWKISWASSGDWIGDSNGAMLMATSSNYKGLDAPYLYRRQASEIIAFGVWDGTAHSNYGIRPGDYGIDGSAYHKYELVNKVDADGSNMIYLYVDDALVGPLDNYYDGGTSTSSGKSDWVVGKDLRFSYLGTARFTIGGCELEYLQVTTCQHEYSQWDVLEATCTVAGYRTRTCLLCDEAQTEMIPAMGHSYEAYGRDATCLDYAHTEHICSVCGDSYKVYDNSLQSDWVEVLPEGVEASDTKTQYRYADKETTTSFDSSLAGHTQVGSQWVRSGSGTVHYVDSWTTGFDTSASLYTQYNKKSSKVTASETDSQKIVIDSDTTVGYLYHHWCYSNSYYSVQSKGGGYNTFHAFYSTTAPGSLTDYDASDGSYKFPKSDICSNTEWWWPTTVKAQKYTTYDKQFTYERWGAWSDWSDTPVEATDSRKVETRTLYRYAIGVLGDHDFTGGICALCGEPCEHGSHDRNGACAVCGGQVDHSYEGLITAPTCTTAGFTTYTCTVCGHSYVGDRTSVAGHDFVSGNCAVCGLVCDHQWAGEECAICGLHCDHNWKSSVCDLCGAAYPRKDYYLFGWIDGRDYACESDFEDLGIYKFENGTLSAVFRQDSYVAVKSDDLDWYMTKTYAGEEVTAGTLYNTKTGASEKLFVPGGKLITFYLVHNGNDTYTLSYVAEECEHREHDVSGQCPVCYQTVEHQYDSSRKAPSCDAEGMVTYTCGVCGHTYSETIPATGHSYVGGTCTGCGQADPDAVKDPGLVLNYPTLSFEDEIIYNVYFSVKDTTSVVEMGLMVLPKMDQNATIADAVALVPGYVTNGVVYLAKSEGIPAANMGDTLYFKV
ncbi:MAG: hypothetical protein IIV61_01825, partial [Oscillospiraceae bacterium]|nr:hypothetical protein [Oscillospiraceae bacterium]